MIYAPMNAFEPIREGNTWRMHEHFLLHKVRLLQFLELAIHLVKVLVMRPLRDAELLHNLEFELSNLSGCRHEHLGGRVLRVRRDHRDCDLRSVAAARPRGGGGRARRARRRRVGAGLGLVHLAEQELVEHPPVPLEGLAGLNGLAVECAHHFEDTLLAALEAVLRQNDFLHREKELATLEVEPPLVQIPRADGPLKRAELRPEGLVLESRDEVLLHEQGRLQGELRRLRVLRRGRGHRRSCSRRLSRRVAAWLLFAAGFRFSPTRLQPLHADEEQRAPVAQPLGLLDGHVRATGLSHDFALPRDVGPIEQRGHSLLRLCHRDVAHDSDLDFLLLDGMLEDDLNLVGRLLVWVHPPLQVGDEQLFLDAVRLLQGQVLVVHARDKLHLLQLCCPQGELRAELLPELVHLAGGRHLDLQGLRTEVNQLYKRHLQRLRLLRRLHGGRQPARRQYEGELHRVAGLLADVGIANQRETDDSLHQPHARVVGPQPEERQHLLMHGPHHLHDASSVQLGPHLLLVSRLTKLHVQNVQQPLGLRNSRVKRWAHAVLEGGVTALQDTGLQLVVLAALVGVLLVLRLLGLPLLLLAASFAQVIEEAFRYLVEGPKLLEDVVLDEIVGFELARWASELDLHALAALGQPEESHARRRGGRHDLHPATMLVPEDEVRHLLLHVLRHARHLRRELREGLAGRQRQAERDVLEVLRQAGVLRVDADQPGVLEAVHHGLELLAHRGHREAAAQLQADHSELVSIRPCLELLQPRIVPVDLHRSAALSKPRVAAEHLDVRPRGAAALGTPGELPLHAVRPGVLPQAQVRRRLPHVRAAALGTLKPTDCTVDFDDPPLPPA
mmetsp:Transcript_10864/g.31843  ORF Transcript_10864/g.31843 Transcript_10864/m.31843 type:complete len:844 (+) Transcript_10864:950-3481(+)